MRTLFLTTAAFAALMIGAPIGKAHADICHPTQTEKFEQLAIDNREAAVIKPYQDAYDTALKGVDPVAMEAAYSALKQQLEYLSSAQGARLNTALTCMRSARTAPRSADADADKAKLDALIRANH